MRNMAFSLTTTQVEKHDKDVTRRIGWENLKVGERVCAIEKGQGLKKGDTVNRLCVIECVSNRKEKLNDLLDRERYSEDDAWHEVLREGFPGKSPDWFVLMFCRANVCLPTQQVNRIEFNYPVHGPNHA